MSQTATPKFNGPDYCPARDNKRLLSQQEQILAVMKKGRSLTLYEISEATGQPEASVSAQLRHLRKARFGSYEVSKVYIRNGLYAYSVKGGPGK